jgi:transcriptional regulator with XRE-family HTH domain
VDNVDTPDLVAYFLYVVTSSQVAPGALAELMADGPFHVALRAAISASGLALDRIRYRLRLRDVTISVPTLSNWQSGRRRPERPESLRALAELEDVLDLPPSALRSLLGPPRPRGRAAHPKGPNAMVEAWGPAVSRLLTTVDMSSDGRLTRLSQHDQIEVDDCGRLCEVANRQVLRASHDGADRWILVWDAGHAERLPEIIAGQHCRLRRLNVDWDTGLMVGELLFDAPLARGETIIMEYRIVYPIQSATRGDTFVRRFHRTTRDYVLQARFDPTALPTRCVRLGMTGNELVPSPNGSAHLVEFNVAGTVGIRWDM